ncbi:metallophosphoesterase family protein [Tenuifilum thalassicum]|uniref:Serine/threonine protein phosphatase n=1 Tax=Tenuifilum thalassicum TaxID=2590900 RepID=A0A7D3XEF1_9BACT|nr:metallophosphoesterase family protein [Tenuifilum thalassicum]QKG79847.1 serine/threonine protein phosphatase [Tenuifilum thalassicum]
MRTLVIPDIHGCLKTLKLLTEVKLSVNKNDRLFFLGDYIDRGPDSPGVIDYITNLIENGYNITCLKGNHEQMLLDSIKGNYEMNLWLMNSGFATIHQYQNQTFKIETEYGFLPEKHYNFLKSLLPYVEVDKQFLLVHGGFNYEASNPFADENAMLWDRPKDVPSSFMPGYKIIHGHTPRALRSIVEEVKDSNRRIYDLDAGCVYKGLYIAGTGYLTALQLETWTLHFVECID